MQDIQSKNSTVVEDCNWITGFLCIAGMVLPDFSSGSSVLSVLSCLSGLVCLVLTTYRNRMEYYNKPDSKDSNRRHSHH